MIKLSKTGEKLKRSRNKRAIAAKGERKERIKKERRKRK